MMMMMLGECWLASRASNLITVITVGIELALTGLSDPTHSYTRAITLITTNIFNKAKSQIQIQIHRQKQICFDIFIALLITGEKWITEVVLT